MKMYFYISAIIAAVALFSYTYIKGRTDGKAAVYAKLEKDHIALVKDGIVIDKEVLSADDNALCDFLGGCLPDEGP